MNDSNAHPARSAEFLSRLHDGELTAAERAHFESHRAHCPECRRCASEFEAALSMFRASRTSPPASDLSARILRRIQSPSPARQRFGIVHGINLKWAAGFAVALIAAVIGLSVVAERDAVRRALAREKPAIPVVLQRGESPAAPAATPRSNLAGTSSPPAQDKRGDLAFAPQPSAERPAATPVPAQAAGSAEKKLEKRSRPSREGREMAADFAESTSARQKGAAAPMAARSAEAPGGEGGVASSLASAEPGAPARLVIQALDGEGNIPDVVNANAGEMLSELRGRRYTLLVEASGRVREARLDPPRPPAMASRQKASAETATVNRAPQAVWNLRFRPGDRPRRLLLRVE